MKVLDLEISQKFSSPTLGLGHFSKPLSDKNKKDKISFAEYAGNLKDKKLQDLQEDLKKVGYFTGKKNEVSLLRYFKFESHQNLLLIGLGIKEKLSSETFRQLGATLSIAQRQYNLDWVDVEAESIFQNEEKTEDDFSYAIQAFSEGYHLAGYEFDELKKPKTKVNKAEGARLVGLPKTAEKFIQRGKLLARAVLHARELGDLPANYLTPSILADKIQKMCKEYSIKCAIWNQAKIEKEKMGLLIGVAKGSTEEPRFIQLEYNGGKGKGHIALIGKAITFDSGGISIKPSAKMEEMKYDMMGGATVAGVFLAAAALKLPINIKGYIAAAENMPSGCAQKPGDVAVSRTGKTVEITNTDAEGRLVLADAIEYAQEKDPEAMIDFATLTGAVLVALGTTTTGIMGNSPELINRLEHSAKFTHEKVWELPLYDEFDEFLQSPVADYKNSSDVRDAGSSKGGTFLKFFVREGLPWVHCDIAGTAWFRRDVNYHPKKYASGAMIRLMTHLLENWKPMGVFRKNP